MAEEDEEENNKDEGNFTVGVSDSRLNTRLGPGCL